MRDGPWPIMGRVKALLAELLEDNGARSQDVLAIGVGVPRPSGAGVWFADGPPIMPGWDRFSVRETFAGEYAAPSFSTTTQT